MDLQFYFFDKAASIGVFLRKKTMKIAEMWREERPREKILTHGVWVASNAELIAVLLGSGTRDCSVLELAQRLLNECEGQLTELSVQSIEKLSSIKGIGNTKAITLTAAFELGRRMGEEKFRLRKKSITGPKDIFQIFGNKLKGLEREECWICLLNQAQYVIAQEKVSLGGSSCTIIDICTILKRVLERKARSVILIHNHPSGNPMPSRADIEQTKKLKEALAPFEVKLLDHLIVSDDSYYSFCDECVYSATSQRAPLLNKVVLNSSK